MPTQNDFDILAQHNQVFHIKLDVLDSDYIKLGEVAGTATSITYGQDANSDIRTNASLTMHVSDPGSLTGTNASSWLNKLIRLYFGLDDASKETNWYLWGTMLVSNNSYSYNETSRELTCTASALV